MTDDSTGCEHVLRKNYKNICIQIQVKWNQEKHEKRETCDGEDEVSTSAPIESFS